MMNLISNQSSGGWSRLLTPTDALRFSRPITSNSTTYGPVRLCMSVVLLGSILGTISACSGTTRVPNVSPPRITVLNAGQESRYLLKYTLTRLRQRMEVSIKIRTDTTVTNTVLETGTQSLDFPTLKVILAVDVTPRVATDMVDVAASVEDATVLDDALDAELRDRMRQYVSGAKGWRTRWRMTSSGATSDLAIEAPANMPQSFSQDLSNVANSLAANVAMFPDVPIGNGARWQVVTQTAFSGVIWNKTTEYTITQLTSSDALVLEADSVLHARPGALKVEPNATTRLVSGRSSSRSELRLSGHSPVPTTATTQTSTETTILAVRGRLRITATTVTQVLSTIRPVSTGQDARTPEPVNKTP